MGSSLPVGNISIVICDKPEKARVLLENCEQGKIPGLQAIILMDLFDDELKDKGAKEGVEILSLQEAEVCESLTYSLSGDFRERSIQLLGKRRILLTIYAHSRRLDLKPESNFTACLRASD